MSKIRDACRRISLDYRPGVTFVTVQKGHHTRFNAADPSERVSN